MYRHIKKVQKSVSKIGPFLKDGKVIMDKPCNILKLQYEKGFSILSDKYKVCDPTLFFEPELKCMDCENQYTHFCPLDLEESEQSQNLHDMNKLVINPDIIQSIMEKLDGTLGCGPDGIPALLLKKCAKTLAKPISNFGNSAQKKELTQ